MSSSAFSGSTFNVYNWVGVCNFSFTMSFRRFTLHCFALALKATNLSVSVTSVGMRCPCSLVLMDYVAVFICYGAFAASSSFGSTATCSLAVGLSSLRAPIACTVKYPIIMGIQKVKNRSIVAAKAPKLISRNP